MRFAFILTIFSISLLGAACTQNLSGQNCDDGLTSCTGSCVDTNTDSDNCGACGVPCEGGATCVAGACEVVCPAGQLNCGGACVDPSTSPQYCGATDDCAGGNAGVECGTGEACSDGACACATPYFECVAGNGCTNLNEDNGNCGACFNACPDTHICSNGTCVANVTAAGALLAQDGRWTFASGVGADAATEECNMHWAGSHSCLSTEVETAAAANELQGLTDIEGNTVNGLWINDPNAPPVLTCNDIDAENVPYCYRTAHLGYQGQVVDLNNADGTIGAVTVQPCNVGTYHVLCCY